MLTEPLLFYQLISDYCNESGKKLNNCSYQHPMYGMSFTRVSNNKREVGTSDETDEEDGEMEDGVPQVSIDSMQSSGPPIQNE